MLLRGADKSLDSECRIRGRNPHHFMCFKFLLEDKHALRLTCPFTSVLSKYRGFGSRTIPPPSGPRNDADASEIRNESRGPHRKPDHLPTSRD